MVSILIDNELQLRSFTPDDAPALFKTVQASRAHLRPWLKWVDLTTKPEHILGFIQRSQQQLMQQKALELGIFHPQGIIGGIGMHDWDQTLKKAQLGYWVTKEFEGQGIVNRCLVRFIDFLFEKPGLNKIEIHFTISNKRSASLSKSLGFQIEGVIRQSYMIHGKLEDIVVTGLLKKEWKSPSPRPPKTQMI